MLDAGLAGKGVLVTGAHRGIGAATALAFAAQGARVAVHHIAGGFSAPEGVTFEHGVGGAEEARRVAELAAQAGAERVVTVGADLSAPGAAGALFDTVEERLGPVDVLVNNAAHCESPDDVLALTADGLHRHYRVNVHAPALLTAELARRRRDAADRAATGGGHAHRPAAVVNVSTDAARAFPGQVGYGTSKAALEAFTRAAAIELGPLGIRVNAVAPGPVQTGWMSPRLVREVEPTIPLRRVGRPEDVAAAVVFLASAQAEWITGQVLQVAGGHAL
ncbi:SDR family NAD(P)-dependent oxidoreductase [Allostreptomyces psammosilenae]|uniref:3-oxoacyl-[acyl-carrier protein] reductase n=1 Tax=Allostreptomyces psammosilenae TaxID=1892865 RepID=A0A852ZZR4_9ACTN|nr:SDR family oxidoreductase [Allostreptomyces psammosilenae]NYI07826.1 3-oxoacyl-[acyl-carrier protein] reductase [Allostreptomyces psammosilenae]